jgi:hypothetical protein
MRMRSTIFIAVVTLAVAASFGTGEAQAPRSIALKSGESVELGSVYFIANCRSIMIGLPEVEVLEGPPEITLTVKEGQVLPRRYNCANKVAGGTVVATAKDIKEKSETKLTYRLKYKTKDGDRQTSSVYSLSLFP